MLAIGSILALLLTFAGFEFRYQQLRRRRANRAPQIIRFVPRSSRPVRVELTSGDQSLEFPHSSNRKEEQQ